MYKNATLLLTASIARYAGQLGIFVLIARLFGATDAGTFALALAVTAPIFIVASLGMRDIYLTLRSNIALTYYERVRAVTVFAAFGISVGISFTFPFRIAIIVAVVACSKSLDSFSDLYGAALQKASSLRLIVLTSVISAAFQIGTFGVAIASGASMPVALSVSTLTYALVILLVVRPITLHVLPHDKAQVSREHVQPPFAARPWVEITRAGFPTGISYGLITALSTMPQYFLGFTWGPADVGKYATLLYLVVAMEMALNALAQSWIPLGRRLETEGALSSTRILGIAARWTLITVPLAFVGIAVATVAFPLIFGAPYIITAAEIFPLGVVMILTPFVFASTISLAIQNRYKWSLVVSAITVVVGIFIGWFLIRPYGIVGALWTFAACLALRAGASLAFTNHESHAASCSTAAAEVV